MLLILFLIYSVYNKFVNVMSNYVKTQRVWLCSNMKQYGFAETLFVCFVETWSNTFCFKPGNNHAI